MSTYERDGLKVPFSPFSMAAAAISSVSSQIYKKASNFPQIASHPKFFSLRRINCSSYPSSSSSPLTEFNSGERRQRDRWLHNDSDIALQLPDPKNLFHAFLLKKQQSFPSHSSSRSFQGSVSLAGTGPGDPDLLTLEAVRAIEKADSILYDRLASNEIMGLVRDDARLPYVGKVLATIVELRKRFISCR